MPPAKLSSEEYAQILQTIEMFEVISQAEPGDCQSYDILKEAYLKIGQTEAALSVSRKLAEAYLHMGLYSSALLECEGILQQRPESPDIVALMGEIESRTHARGDAPTAGTGANGADDYAANGASEGSPAGFTHANLIALNGHGGYGHGGAGTGGHHDGGATEGPTVPFERALGTDDGNEPFARFLIGQRLAPEADVLAALGRVRQLNGKLAVNLNGSGVGGNVLATSLLDEVARATGRDADEMLSGLIDATKFGFIPLEHYDMDRAIVRLLPESLTLRRLMVPFDIVSRTVMIALCNPFDAAAKEAAAAQLDYHIQWYLARPSAVIRVLRDAYRLDARD